MIHTTYTHTDGRQVEIWRDNRKRERETYGLLHGSLELANGGAGLLRGAIQNADDVDVEFLRVVVRCQPLHELFLPILRRVRKRGEDR
jgi:hypothetical protein